MMHHKEQILTLVLSLSVVVSSWFYIDDIYSCSNVLLVAGLYFLVLLIRCENDLINCRNYLIPYQVVFLVLVGFLVCSIFNESHVYSSYSNSFVLAESRISWLPSSSASHATLRSLPYMAFLIGIVGPVIFCILDGRLLRRLLWVLLVNSLLLAIVGMVVKYSGSSKMLGIIEPPHGTERYFFSTFTYKNHWGCYMILSLGVVATLFELYKHISGHKYNLLFFVCLVVFAFAVILSGSRSCSLIYLFLLGLFFFRVFLIYIPKFKFRFLVIIFSTVLLLTCVVSIALMSDAENFDEMWNTTRIYVSEFLRDKTNTRLSLSLGTWDMFMESAVFGWGLGSYEFVFNFYKSGEFRGKELTEEMHFIYAHNDILQYFAEIGIAGTALLLFVFTIPLIYWLKHKIKSSKWLLLVCFIVLLYSFIEFPFRTPAVSLMFTILYAAACRVQFRTLGD